jgi:cbb3-type cytochrome c oxidase subunit III
LAPQCACPEDVKKIETSPTAIQASSAAQRQSGSTIIVALPTDPAVLATDVRRGALLFGQNCASCHGASANGKGPAAATLLPQPADLSDGKRSVAGLSSAITNGVPGSAMPAWRDFPQRDVEALVAFVKSVERPQPSSASSANSAQIASGQKLFQAQCISCHGTRGDGNGAAAGALALCPTNFIEEQPSSDDMLRALEHGIAGTSMPPWKDQISLVDRQALTVYVRSLYRGN